jgi:hypothetical protein
MFKRVERDDDFDGTRNGGGELALGADSGLLSLFPTNLQLLLADVETDHAFGAELGHLLHFQTGAAAKIEDHFVFDLSFDSWQQNSQLAFALVGFTTHCGRNPLSNQAQKVILKRGKHTGQVR